MRRLTRTAAWALGAALIVGLGAGQAQASLIIYTTAPGATNNGNLPVSAEADITTGNGTITIVLKDLLANPGDVSQLVSDFHFTVANGGNLTSSTLSSSSGQDLNVAGNGTFTTGSTVSTGWDYTGTATGGDLTALGQSGPQHLIIGPPGGGGTYSNANGSIAGNPPHNPFLNQSATFTISAAGVTANTTITAVQFSFGTTAGNNVPGVPGPAVPEPATILGASIAGLAGLLFAWRRRTA